MAQRRIPLVRDEPLLWREDEVSLPIRIGTPAWYVWLSEVSSFSFESSEGTFTALLLAFYWHVYRTCRDLGSNAYLSPTMRGFYQGVVAGLLCFIVTGFAGSSLRPTPEFAFLWIAIGMMYGQLARRRAGT